MNGVLGSRLSGASFLTFDGIDADALIVHLSGLDLSAASACHSGTPELSYALQAVGRVTNGLAVLCASRCRLWDQTMDA